MSTSGQQAQQKVRQDRQDAPDRHPSVTEKYGKAHDFGSGRWRSQPESGMADSQKKLSVPQTEKHQMFISLQLSDSRRSGAP